MMCGITGFTNYNGRILNPNLLLENMTEKISKRGENDKGYYIKGNVYLGHRRLSIIDIDGGKQPMTFEDSENNKYTIVYNGEIYNYDELKNLLTAYEVNFETRSDTEMVIKAYMLFKERCLNYLTGIFAFCIYDESNNSLFFARDHIGVKPLFYTVINNDIFFGSEIKCILENNNIQRVLDKEGIAKLFGLGPARMMGETIFKDINEIKPGHYATFKDGVLKEVEYFKISSYEHTDSLEDTIKNVRYMLEESIKKQLISDVNIGSFLSGGIDSSIVTGISSKYINDEKLKTFSVDYVDNDINFKSTDFTPSRDNEYIELMKEKYSLNHRYIVLDNSKLYETLYDAMIARDMPSMADIDSSLLLLCSEVKKDVTVALSGEFADEMFCGYPWFYREDSLNSNTFPWSISVDLRDEILNEKIRSIVNLKEYVNSKYKEAINEIPLEGTVSEKDADMKMLSYLTMFYFGENLLDRTDRMSMLSSLEVRVPFVDYKLIEYVYNIPWEMKNINGMEKGILREAFKDVVPEEILNRKKSPYPKTYSPVYTKLVQDMLTKVIDNPSNRIKELVDISFVRKIINMNDEEFSRPWFGQLMMRPQLMAYLLQLEMWLREYNIKVII